MIYDDEQKIVRIETAWGWVEIAFLGSPGKWPGYDETIQTVRSAMLGHFHWLREDADDV